MLSFLTTLVAKLGLKTTLIIVALVTAIGLGLIALAKARASGRQAERLDQLEERIKSGKLSAQLNARIDAIAADDARRRLLKRWSDN
jgi:acid phosphatase family membrane protein YuiD